MRHRFLSTTPDGGVDVTIPSRRALWFLTHGGRWPEADPAWLETLVQRFVASGVGRDVAERWVNAMSSGGLGEHDALWLIAEISKLKGAVELVDVSEIPADRTHRNAWRRSHNGGPIWIDEAIAQRIDELRMWRAYDAQTT